MNKTLKILALSSVMALSISITAHIAMAAGADGTYVPLTTVPGVFTQGTETNPISVLKGIYGIAIGIGGIIAVIMIILGGFKYMYVESIDGKSGAKDQITNAFLGLLVILGSYIILRTINVDLVNFNLTLPGGSGRLSGLVAQQAAIDKLRADLHQSALNSTARVQEISTLESTVADNNAQMARIQALIDAENRKPQTATTTVAIQTYKDQLAQLQTTTVAAQATLAGKKVDNTLQTNKDILGVSHQTSIATEISTLNTLVTSKDTKAAALKSRDALTNIASAADREITAVASNVDKLSAVPATGDAALKKDAAILNGQQDIAYLTLSKTMVNEMNASIDTSGGSGVRNQSLTYDKIAASYQKKADDLEAAGRPDLAAALKSDLAQATTIMKIRNAPNCNDQNPIDRDQISLCKQ